MFEDNKDFYPTPTSLIGKMYRNIPREAWRDANYILEPQAGAGHIVEYLYKNFRHSRPTIHCIEKDERLAAMLRGKGYTVVDHDFLGFSGPDKYDIIIMNPPFSSGHHHLLKAIDILFSGHISCLLNAETIRKPHTNARKLLIKKLDELGADIEYLQGEFESADRKTSVEVALIHIHVEKKIEEDLFDGITDAEEIDPGEAHQQREIAEKESIRGMVADYNRKVEIGTRTLLDFYRNYHHVSPFMTLLVGDEERSRYIPNGEELTAKMKYKLNEMVCSMRKSYWQKALELGAIRRRLTSKKADEFHEQLKRNAFMDFTENNIRTFILNLLKSYEDVLTDAVVSIFNMMTKEYVWDENLHNDNVHYFNGWKTNKAFYVNSKVIIPFYGDPFWSTWNSRWEVKYDVIPRLDDIDKVMNYFDGMSEYYSIVEALTHSFARGETRGVESTYFKISVFKKGTIHLTFLSEDIRRRFNVTACKGKDWLPYDYGQAFYETLDPERRAVVDCFEGQESYDLNVHTGPSLFRTKPAAQIGMDNVVPMTPRGKRARDLAAAINKALPTNHVKAIGEREFEIINGAATGHQLEAESMALGRFRKQLLDTVETVSRQKGEPWTDKKGQVQLF